VYRQNLDNKTSPTTYRLTVHQQVKTPTDKNLASKSTDSKNLDGKNLASKKLDNNISPEKTSTTKPRQQNLDDKTSPAKHPTTKPRQQKLRRQNLDSINLDHKTLPT